MMHYRRKRGPKRAICKIREMNANHLPTISDKDLARHIVDKVFNLYAVEIVNRLIGNPQKDFSDDVIIKQTEKMIKKQNFYNVYLNEALRRFKKRIKMPVP